MPSSVPNAKWYEVDGSYDKKKKDYRLLREGVVIADVKYRPSEGVWRWETIYGVPRGGLGMGRHDKGKYVSKKPLALSLAEKEIIEKERVTEDWSKEYKRSINCNNPKGFSQRAHCQGRKKHESVEVTEAAAVTIVKGKRPNTWITSHGKYMIAKCDEYRGYGSTGNKMYCVYDGDLPSYADMGGYEANLYRRLRDGGQPDEVVDTLAKAKAMVMQWVKNTQGKNK
jgi:hypothetical protein